MARTNIDNLATGGTIRAALNAMFTELYYIFTGKAGGLTLFGGTLTTQRLSLRGNAADTTSGGVDILDSTDATDKTDGSLHTAGGISAAKKAFFGATTVDSLAVGALAGVLKGTAGAVTGSATTADLPDSADKRYVTDANLVTIGNQSGTNTGDETGESGKPFRKTVTLTAAAAATPVNVLLAATVGAGKKAYVSQILLKVDGATAWEDETATIVTIQDTADVPVVGATFAKSALTGNAFLGLFSTGVTVDDEISEGEGFTTAKGIDIVADANFAAGSDIIVTVFGYIA